MRGAFEDQGGLFSYISPEGRIPAAQTTTLEGAGCEFKHNLLGDTSMSHMGQTRRFHDVRIAAALPPTPDIRLKVRHGRNVPKETFGSVVMRATLLSAPSLSTFANKKPNDT